MLWLVLALLAAPVAGSPAAASPITIEHPAFIPVPQDAPAEAEFLALISNSGPPDELVSITSPAAATVSFELHFIQGGHRLKTTEPPYPVPTVVTQGQDTQLVVDAMLTGLVQDLATRASVPVVLHFAHAGDVVVTAPSTAPGPPAPPPPTGAPLKP